MKVWPYNMVRTKLYGITEIIFLIYQDHAQILF
jgi:hypothetical protein